MNSISNNLTGGISSKIPQFSVVIPLYNKAHTIVSTMATVINQIYKNFEVIIVDDGSTDNGVQLIREHFKDPRIRIIHQENAGVSAARNRGIDEARGEWVAFLDGDDEWHPEYLSIMRCAIEKFPQAVMISSAGLIHNADGRLSYRIANKYMNRIIMVDYFENPSVFSHTSSTVVNRKIANQTNLFPKGMKCLEDFAFFYQMAMLGNFVYVGLPISKYVGGVEGQITRSDDATRFSFMPSVVRFYNEAWEIYRKQSKKNPVFITFFKYDLRHRIKCYISQSDPKWMDYFFNGIDKNVKHQLTWLELFLYQKRLKRLSLIWINLTKIVWRTHRYPLVGEKNEINNVEKKYLVW